MSLFKLIRNKLIDWCYSYEEITIEELYQQYQPIDCKIYQEGTNNVKFIGSSAISNISVKTPTGYSPIKQVLKTIPYEIWTINTPSYSLECADEHIVIDENNNEIFVKDLKINDKIQTSTGLEPIISISKSDQITNMYDLELDDNNHVYYTNNILSHNSQTSAAFILWYAMFNTEKVVLIASNKNDNAMEMIHRIKYMYMYLPHWLKPGLQDDGWNKHQIGFDNGSRIISTATSENSGRGLSISLLFLDEFAFVRDTVQEEFWTSMAPTLATGGACIITSTPNGDSNLFATIWRGANIPASYDSNVGSNGFVPIEIAWNEPPGRDEKFKKKEIAKIGEVRWKQEYECIQGESEIEIMTESGIIYKMPIAELYRILSNNIEI